MQNNNIYLEEYQKNIDELKLVSEDYKKALGDKNEFSKLCNNLMSMMETFLKFVPSVQDESEYVKLILDFSRKVKDIRNINPRDLEEKGRKRKKILKKNYNEHILYVNSLFDEIMKINDYIDNEFGITKEKKEEENKEDKQ
ncbi:MAG: hypothetical protein K5892_02775 [Acholeplasmatales bacterium]|jgi:hypothetical protein|nr:hypothetical protein [Acholeplasmatales bacterium]